MSLRPLKIALLSQGYWEDHHRHTAELGGSLQQLAEAVAALGHEVVVLTQSPQVRQLKKSPLGALEVWLSSRTKPRDVFTGLRDKFVRKTLRHPKAISDALVLRDFLKRRGPFDAVWAAHAETDGLVAALSGKLKFRLPPLLVQVQSLPHHFVKREIAFEARNTLGMVFRRAARILVPSELLAASLTHYTGPGLTLEALQGKVRLAPPNLHRSFFAAAQDTGMPGPMKDRVLFLGAINRSKGALVFMDAISKTQAAQRDDTVFVVVGDFTNPTTRHVKRWEEIKETTRLRLGGARMEFTGHVSTFEVIRQIRLAQVVVVPALFDPSSRSLIEALTLGRPVITTDRTGAASLVQQYGCGLIVPPFDPPTLAQGIDAALDPAAPYLDNTRQIAPKLFSEFSPDTVAVHLAYHLDRIVPQKA